MAVNPRLSPYRFRFRAAVRQVSKIPKPQKPLEVLGTLFRDGATGLDAIIRLGSTVRALYHGVLYATMFVVSVVLIVYSFVDYFAYEVNTVSKLIDYPDGLTLPKITVCHTKGFKWSILCADEHLPITADLCSANDSAQFAGYFRRALADQSRRYQLRTIAERAEFRADDIIESCFIRNERCPNESIGSALVSYPRFGRCVCLFCNSRTAEAYASYRKSYLPYAGLSLVLNAGRHHEFANSTSVGASFVVLLHDTGDSPDVNLHATYIAGNVTTFLATTLRVIQRLPPPYKGQCRDRWLPGSPVAVRNLSYSQHVCARLCRVRYIMRTCKCRRSNVVTELNYMDLSAVCFDTPLHRACLKRVQTQKDVPCDCPPACREKVYDTTASTAGWVRPITRAGLSRVLVYYTAVGVELTGEVPKFDFLLLLNVLGGYFGMFVGYSFLILYELGDISLRYVLDRWQRRKLPSGRP